MSETAAKGHESFCETVTRRAGTAVGACFQCHKCTTGCPVGPEMDLLPSQVMRLVHLGERDEVLRSKSIWLCASCEACTTRCPMGINIAGVMDMLRIMAVEEQAAVPDAHVKQFNRSFLSSVRRHGRVFRGRHAGRPTSSARATFFPTWARCRKCCSKASWPSCPSAAVPRPKCAKCSAGRKPRRNNSEIRLLPRLQPGIDGLGFQPFDAGCVPQAGNRTGRDSRLGVLRFHTGPRLQPHAGRGPAGREPAKGQDDEPAGDDRLRVVLRPAAHGESQGPAFSGRARPGRPRDRQTLRRLRAGVPRARRARESAWRRGDQRKGSNGRWRA